MGLNDFINRIYDMKALSNRFRQVEVPLVEINHLRIQAYFRIPSKKFTTILDFSKRMKVGEKAIYDWMSIWNKHHMIEIENIRNGKRMGKIIRRRFKVLVILDDKTIQFLE